MITQHLPDQLGRPEYLAYNWQDQAQRAQTLQALSPRLDPARPIALIWSAGRAGFGSTPTEMEVETNLLREVLDYIAAHARKNPDIALYFTSSAGGLFEGMSHVTTATVPAPLRAYGQAKLIQEQMVQDMSQMAGFRQHIYRLSSVYGYAPRCRLGLISTLIMNALTGKETKITGNKETLRDYVSAMDIGQYLATQALKAPRPDLNSAGTEPVLLASGQSVSIAQIIDLIKERVDRPVQISYQSQATNDANMSFSPEALPQDWTPKPLIDGIEHTITTLRQHAL